MSINPLLARLRHHVTGAIERGEKQAIVEQPSPYVRAMQAYEAALAEGADYDDAMDAALSVPDLSADEQQTLRRARAAQVRP